MLYSPWLYAVTSICFERFSRCASLVSVAPSPAGVHPCFARITGRVGVRAGRASVRYLLAEQLMSRSLGAVFCARTVFAAARRR